MQTSPNTRRLLLCATASLLLPLHAVSLLAQVTAANSNAPADAAPEVVQLSPFVVTASDDRGYQAQNTVSGTRLRTSLKEIAAPVSAFTEQFLDDTGITNIEDLADLMVSTQYHLGADGGSQNSFNGNTLQLRVRGLPGGAASVNFFPSDMRWDRFSLDRIEQSRGPNSILFGVGQPGGLINVTTKRASLQKSSGETSFHLSSYDGMRAELDYNAVAATGVMAVRVAAVSEKIATNRNWEFNDSDRLFATLKLKPAKNTEFDVEVERGLTSYARHRTYTAIDSYSQWAAAGSQVSATPNATAYIARLTTATQPHVTIDTATGTLTNWVNATISARRRSSTGEQMPLNDESILPREVNYAGPGVFATADYTRFSGFLSHAFTKDWHLELAFFRNTIDDQIVDVRGAGSWELQADTNATLPNGAPNPNAGRPYFEGYPLRFDDHNHENYYRAITSYQLDLGRTFGRHTLAAVYQHSDRDQHRVGARQQIVENPYNTTTAENAQNIVWWRTYLDLDGPADRLLMSDWRQSDPNNRPVVGSTAANSRSSIGTAWVPFSANGSYDNDQQSDTVTGMIQSAFFDGRLTTVVGASHDEQTNHYSTQVREPLAGFTTGILKEVYDPTPYDSKADNATFSGVLRTLPWLYLTYNQSRNSSTPDSFAYIPQGHAPAPQASSRDIGVKLDLFDGKVFLTAAYFETTAERDFSYSGIRQQDINPIWTALDDAGVLSASGMDIVNVSTAANGSTFDSAADGFEVELTANLTKNWRLYFNASQLNLTRTNIGLDQIAYIADNRDLWLANGTVALNDGTAGTVATQVARLDQQIFDLYTLAEGEKPRGQEEYRANARTNYEFASGPLKGVSVGLGLRYRSAPVTAYSATTNPDGSISSSERLGKTNTLFDANIGYRGTFQLRGHKVAWSVQLNIDNLLDNQDFFVIRETRTGELLNYLYNPPRSWVLSTRFRF